MHNGHVKVLTKMADNTITVSAIHHLNIYINEIHQVPRDVAIRAFSLGDNYIRLIRVQM
jgi:hypothetical protein